MIQHGIIRNEVISYAVEVHIYVYIHVGTYRTELEMYLSFEAWSINSDGY
jgi:hypothetical protein